MIAEMTAHELAEFDLVWRTEGDVLHLVYGGRHLVAGIDLDAVDELLNADARDDVRLYLCAIAEDDLERDAVIKEWGRRHPIKWLVSRIGLRLHYWGAVPWGNDL